MFPLKSILKADLCSGCGVCAGICPFDCIEMKESITGEYRPRLVSDLCTECGLCEKVCPFGNGLDEDKIGKDRFSGIDGIQKTSRGGYILSAVCGGVVDQAQRLERTSGGLGVWMLGKLLDAGVVDRVISVRSCREPGKLFEFAEFSSSAEIRSSTKSCYYPVELSGCIKRILKNPTSQYAVVGVPCAIKALQKACYVNRRLNQSVRVTVGLVCSCQKTKHFAEYLIRRVDIEPEQVVGFSFRVKDGETDADNCLMVNIETADGSNRTVRHEEYARMWSGGCFSMKACGFCDDHFAEAADISLMDAKHLTNPLGTTVALVRSSRLQKLLQEGQISGELSLEDISIQQALDSQNGCDLSKRNGTACMLNLYKKDLPVGFSRRVVPSKKHYIHFWLKDRRRKESQKAFLRQQEMGAGVDFFWKQLKKNMWPEQVINVVRVMRDLMKRLVSKVKEDGKSDAR